MEEKTVGILGGMGSYATLKFFENIIKQTPAKKDWEHLRIIIDNNTNIPSRTRAVLYNEESPVQSMIQSIINLSSIGVDFVAVPCNSAHYFYDEVASFIKIEWLNMIEIVSQKVLKEGCKAPLIIGGYVTVEKKLYSKYLPDAVYPSKKDQDFIIECIEQIKLTTKLYREERLELLDVFSEYFLNSDADSVLLACTEFGLFHLKGDVEVFDSSKIYAKKIVDYAKGIE